MCVLCYTHVTFASVILTLTYELDLDAKNVICVVMYAVFSEILALKKFPVFEKFRDHSRISAMTLL